MEKELHEVTNLMRKNIDSVLERGERMNSLVDKTVSLQDDALAFRRASNNVKKEAWWVNMQGIITFVDAFGNFSFFFTVHTITANRILLIEGRVWMVIIVVGIAYVFVALQCGIFLEQCRT